MWSTDGYIILDDTITEKAGDDVPGVGHFYDYAKATPSGSFFEALKQDLSLGDCEMQINEVPVASGTFSWLPTVSFVLILSRAPGDVRSKVAPLQASLELSLKEAVYNPLSWFETTMLVVSMTS